MSSVPSFLINCENEALERRNSERQKWNHWGENSNTFHPKAERIYWFRKLDCRVQRPQEEPQLRLFQYTPIKTFHSAYHDKYEGETKPTHFFFFSFLPFCFNVKYIRHNLYTTRSVYTLRSPAFSRFHTRYTSAYLPLEMRCKERERERKKRITVHTLYSAFTG